MRAATAEEIETGEPRRRRWRQTEERRGVRVEEKDGGERRRRRRRYQAVVAPEEKEAGACEWGTGGGGEKSRGVGWIRHRVDEGRDEDKVWNCWAGLLHGPRFHLSAHCFESHLFFFRVLINALINALKRLLAIRRA
ncbi:unnamed protein product [Urochloa humidicola]